MRILAAEEILENQVHTSAYLNGAEIKFYTAEHCLKAMNEYAYQREIAFKEEISDLRELLYWCFRQGTQDEQGRFNHNCISAYEDAQEYLLYIGSIFPEQCHLLVENPERFKEDSYEFYKK